MVFLCWIMWCSRPHKNSEKEGGAFLPQSHQSLSLLLLAHSSFLSTFQMANSSFRRLSGLVSQALIRSSSSTLGFSLPKTNHVRTFAASSKPAAASKKPAAASKKPAAATGSDKSTKKKAAPSGISKPIPISAALQDVFGVPEIARTQALKQIWVHIKEHNLQDPEDKKIIVCDEKLKKVFAGKERVGFLEIARLLSPHFIK